MMLLLFSSTVVGYLSLQGSRVAVAQSGSGSKWTGVYSGSFRAEDLNGFQDWKDSGRINFTIDSTGYLTGNGSGHVYYSAAQADCDSNTPPNTLHVNGDTRYNFTLFGDFPDPSYGGNLTFSVDRGTGEGVSPSSFNGTYVCGSDSSKAPLPNLAPLWDFTSLVGRYTAVSMQIQNGSGMWHHYNSTSIGGGTATETDDITISGSLSKCPPTFKGAFEPVQAVWQDDELFPDNNKLTKVDDRHYTAGLDMIDGKQTLLFGIKDDRYNIHLDGEVKTTVNVQATVQFTLHDSLGDTTLYEYDAGELPLDGPCDQEQPVNVKIPASDGVPSQPFTFDGPGPYYVTMELMANGKPVEGSQIVLSGSVTAVPALKVLFIPVYLNETSPSQVSALVTATRNLALDSSNYIPDFYPLAGGLLDAAWMPVALDWRSLSTKSIEACGGINTGCYQERLIKEGMKEATATAWFTGRARVVIVLGVQDFAALRTAWGAPPDFVAFTVGTKGIFARVTNSYKTIAHELAHTLPTFPWLESGDCGINYHNQGNYGNGFQVTSEGTPSPTAKENVGGIMGPANPDFWIEQCTYWHLISALNSASKDPAVLGVRGWIHHNDSGPPSSGESGGFDPGYNIQGAADLNATGSGNYSLVFKDREDATLARYNFNMTFATESGFPVLLNEFGYRVIIPEGSNELDLVGSYGAQLASEKVPAEGSPSFSITSPAPGSTVSTNTSGQIIASWKGTGGQNLTFSVLVSPNNGTIWYPVLLDTNQTSTPIDVKLLSPGSANVLEVIATDGFHSQSSFVHFALPGANGSQTITGSTSVSASGTNPFLAIQIPVLAAVALAVGVVAAVGVIFLHRHRKNP